jgi:hypothetical protein
MPLKSTNCNSRKSTKKPSGVVKSSRCSLRKPSSNRQLRSGNKYFWYDAPDGVDRYVTSSGVLQEYPRNIVKMIFDPSKFAHEKYPSTFPPGVRWPLRTAQDLLRAFQSEDKLDNSLLSSYDSVPSYLFQHSGDEHCVGPAYFDGTVCSDPSCSHTFERWSASVSSWEEHFELRKTANRGMGVYTKRAFEQNDVLGWYAGEIVPESSETENNDYLMSVPIGIVTDPDDLTPPDNDDDDDYAEGLFRASRQRSEGTSKKKRVSDESDVTGQSCILVDAQRTGNWTRFINHSCQSLCFFLLCRVGEMRCMAVLAGKRIPAGVELTVNYGEGYYGKDTDKVCHCGAKKCGSRFRKQ